MATRQTGALELVARCRKVGWSVTKVVDGWRVKTATGLPVVVHQTPSDVNGYKATAKTLNDNGLSEAERDLAEREETERQQKIAADRERNDRRTELMNGRATALAKAAGPYGPAQVTLDDVLGDHPAPLVFHRVQVTPDMARALLERNNPTERAAWPNRRIRPADVAQWSQVLRSGRWRYTHQGVALDVDGRLQDGQHRLSAIAETGVAAEMQINVGMPRENFAVIDVGRRRTSAQVLHMVGASNAAWVSAAVRLLYLYDVWDAATLGHLNERVANDAIVGTYERLDRDCLNWALQATARLRQQLGTAPAGPAAAFYVLRERVDDHGRVEAFVESLIRGVGLEDNDPAYALRRQLTRSTSGIARKLSSGQQMALVIKGWNAYVQGTKPRLLMIREDSTMPAVYVPPEHR